MPAEHPRKRPRIVHLHDGSGRVLRRTRSPRFQACLTRTGWLIREWRIFGSAEAHISFSGRDRCFFCNSMHVNDHLVKRQLATPYVPRFEFKLPSVDGEVNGLLEVRIGAFLFAKVDWLRLSIGNEIVYEEGDERAPAWQFLIDYWQSR